MENWYDKEDLHKILYTYTINVGESVWEFLESYFIGREEGYLTFLVENSYITREQKDNWIKIYDEVYGKDDTMSEYSNIEAMTFISVEDYPIDVMEEKGCIIEDSQSSNYLELDVKKAREKGLINVPVLITDNDVDEYNDIYWNKVLYIIGHYLSENRGVQEEVVDELKLRGDCYQ